MTQFADNEYLFTSESVTEGHPDKVADQISDGVLDAVLRDDPYGRVACETLVNTGLVVGTGPDAIRRIKDAKGSLPDQDAFKRVERRSENTTSLGFLDFSQLLELGEQTGLNDSRAYQLARGDLHRVQAIGISSHSGEGETTAEILLSIP